MIKLYDIDMAQKYLTIRQAAKIIGVTELTLRNWDRAGKFAATRHPINNYRIYTLDQIDSLMQKIGKGKASRKLIVKVLEDEEDSSAIQPEIQTPIQTEFS